MCLATPMKVIQVQGNIAKVDAFGVELDVAIDLVEDVNPNDYLIVHAGYAINRLSPEEAEETLSILKRLQQANE